MDMESDKIRLFIAAKLPARLNAQLSDYGGGYAAAHIKPVPAANLHLTLLFLGNTEAGKLTEIKRIVNTVAKNQRSFTLTAEVIEPGPKPSHPRLIWARFYPDPQFTQLCTRLQELLLPDTKIPDNYLPHVTLARINKQNRQGLILPYTRPAEPVAFKVNSISIWQSQLASPHPQYSVLQSYNLLPA